MSSENTLSKSSNIMLSESLSFNSLFVSETNITQLFIQIRWELLFTSEYIKRNKTL